MTLFQAARIFFLGTLVLCGFMISVFAENPNNPTNQCKCIEQPTIPLHEQNISDHRLLNWASEAAMASYSFDYMNYRKQLQTAGAFYTPLGWERYILGLEKSKNLETIQKKKMVGTAIPTDKPLIKWKGQTEGIFTWKVEIPMLVIYETHDKKIKQNVIVQMLIKRTTDFVGRDNLGIMEFNVTPT